MNPYNWQTNLDEVEKEIRACLTALDRYEATFVGALRAEATVIPVKTNESVLQERLTVAGNHAEAVERLIAEQEQAWGEWNKKISDWAGTLSNAGGEKGLAEALQK